MNQGLYQVTLRNDATLVHGRCWNMTDKRLSSAAVAYILISIWTEQSRPVGFNDSSLSCFPMTFCYSSELQRAVSQGWISVRSSQSLDIYLRLQPWTSWIWKTSKAVATRLIPISSTTKGRISIFNSLFIVVLIYKIIKFFKLLS